MVKYHCLKTTCPKSLLREHGYPDDMANKSQGGSWFAFDGNKETDLEPAFAPYLILLSPSYMPKTKNMALDEIVAIITTSGADESEGWLKADV